MSVDGMFVMWVGGGGGVKSGLCGLGVGGLDGGREMGCWWLIVGFLIGGERCWEELVGLFFVL